MLSASADSSMNSADEGITSDTVSLFFPVPNGNFACGHTFSNAVSSVFALHHYMLLLSALTKPSSLSTGSCVCKLVAVKQHSNTMRPKQNVT